jgi:hypothetical protein
MCGAQNPMVTPPAAVPVAPSGVITVAEGTTVALTLVSSVKSKSTKPGDAVRAVVAFPVTVGTQLAIPPGTYVEGVVNAVTARAPKTHMASVQLHFTKLLFANGYSVALNAVNTDAMVILPGRKAGPPTRLPTPQTGRLTWVRVLRVRASARLDSVGLGRQHRLCPRCPRSDPLPQWWPVSPSAEE